MMMKKALLVVGLYALVVVASVFASDGIATHMEPGSIGVLDANVLPPPSVVVYLEVNTDAFTAADIDRQTLSLNGSQGPESAVMFPSQSSNEPNLLVCHFSLSKLLSGYYPVIGTVDTTYLVTGKFSDGTVFKAEGDVTVVGFPIGDVNLDGYVDISDLMYLIDFQFRDGAAPVLLETADIDGNGSVDISDLMLLIDQMFIG